MVSNKQGKRSGSYTLVRICINEIEAMDKLGFSPKTIRDRLETFFGIALSSRQLSNNSYQVKNDHDKDGEPLLNKKKVAEMVENPELIQRNFYTYQQIINPGAGSPPIPAYDRRHEMRSVAPSQAPAQRTAAHSSPQRPKPVESAPPPSSEKPSPLAQAPTLTDEQREMVEKMLKIYQTYRGRNFPPMRQESLDGYVVKNLDHLATFQDSGLLKAVESVLSEK